ncbi:E3 ubiquitin-protein ligase TRIM39-like [Megalobrama amblycephala]|uniref:E3 ubiquitin-protein ligase TRIM39-like n=1 Tax=Megalobrama amblycephala TaxID=75352 RepID=UPI0020143133|nr:E3 ubiquitin-protein ligase TRIM39-like [Megalobrama amblycephala]
MAQSSPTSTKARKTRRWSIEHTPPYYSVGDLSSFLFPAISSSSGPLTEELQCSICLDVFTDPVTTPCGHNFCKTCLNKFWDNSQTCKCPYCKETFKHRPDLKINITLRELVDHYKKKSPEKKTKVVKKPEVLCDFCEERNLKALKSCLVCQSSYCETHLKPHLKVAGLKKHKLINPVRNLEDYICQKHERPLELFCRDDQTCVCPMCDVTDHKNHNTVPMEVESEDKKTQLMKTQKNTQQMIQDRIKKIQEVKHLAEIRKRNTEKEKAVRVELFTDLIRSIERCQTELLEMMEEQQKAAEKQKEELIEKLEQEITELKMRNTELEQLSHTEDHLHLLQIYSSLCSSRNTRNWSEISMKTDESLETLRRALTRLQDTLQEKLTLTGTSDDVLLSLVSTVLKRMQQYEVDVTLDPDTAHPKLILSDDGKQVRCGDTRQKLPDKPERFDYCVDVLGKEGFSSRRFYFEVQVKGKTDWDLGVARESINRKGKITASPSNGCWTVQLRNGNEYKAGAGPPVSLCLRVKPQRVGVFVDYEEGLVSFYDVESSSYIYSFTGQSFTGKLYPLFSPCFNDGGKNSTPLIITPVNYEFTVM